MDAKDEKNVKEACWIKHIDLVVYNYNIPVYSATCKLSFELFTGAKGLIQSLVLKMMVLYFLIQKQIHVKKKNNKEVVSEVEVSICAKYLARIDKKAIYNSVYNFNAGEYVFSKKRL